MAQSIIAHAQCCRESALHEFIWATVFESVLNLEYKRKYFYYKRLKKCVSEPRSLLMLGTTAFLL